jgi:putative exosortase-associated protein (TIGR04073 family)
MQKRVGKFLAMALVMSFVVPCQAQESYGEAIAKKAGMGFANLGLGWLELPRNIVATTNQTNLAVGLTGGTVKGIIHTAGRILSGAADVLTFPFPTQPITQPEFVWQEFTTETKYGPIFVPKN